MLEGDKPEDRRAIFLINEGVKQKVWKTAFIGNTIASDDRLRTQIKSKSPFLYLFKGELDRKEVEEDIQRLTAYYRGLGFFRARIGREIEFNDKENWATITFIIDEGPRYRVRNVSIVGNTRYPTTQLLDDLKLKNNEYFNQAKMTTDIGSIQDKYGSIGYVFADVKADPRFLEEPAQLDLVYNLKEGGRYRVGKVNIEIKGEYPHTQITTILNRLSFKPGDIVDIREIRSSERRIRASQLFEANMATGNAPKIVFTPPGQEELQEEPENKKRSEVARRPRNSRGLSGRAGGGPSGVGGGVTVGSGGSSDDDDYEGESNYRGQSPDEPDRDVDVTLDCGRYIGPQAAESAQAASTASNSNVHVYATPDKQTTRIVVEPEGASRARSIEVHSPAASPTSSSDLRQMASELSADLAKSNHRQQSRDRLIPTQQYTANATQDGSTTPNSGLRWTSYAPQTPQPTADVSVNAPALQAPAMQPVATQTTGGTSVQAAPAYGQMWPRQNGPERAVDSPDGPYTPGPIFSESSPFRDGPPDGGQTLQPLPFKITADETMTGRIMFGIGVNSDSGLVGSVVLDEQNFDFFRFPSSFEDIRNGTAWRGAGKRFRMEAAPGTSTSRYAVTYQDPYLFDTKVSMGLSGYYYTRIYDEYTEQRLGGRVAMGYQLSPDLSATVAYRGAKINITDPIDPAYPDLADVIGRDLALHGFAFTMTHDKRDNAFLATEGHLAEWSIEQVLGSFQYLHSEIDLRKYFTLYERPDGSGRHVLTLAARAGVTGDDTPIYDRYYAGGYSTIRGFSYRHASPVAAGPTNGDMIVTGGDFELFASAEYMFPITADDMLRAVVFCDTGTVEPRFDNWSNKYRVAPGFGLRICVPAMGPAPIALDFAFPISWQPGDRQELFSFFMGFGR